MSIGKRIIELKTEEILVARLLPRERRLPGDGRSQEESDARKEETREGGEGAASGRHAEMPLVTHTHPPLIWWTLIDWIG